MASRRRTRPADLPILGWREWIALPDLGIPAVKAKIDTGARSSSLHATELEVVRRGGRKMVRFRVHPHQRDTRRSIVAEAVLRGERGVRSSSGQIDRRPLILTSVELGGRRWLIELTLAQRGPMGFRMLLGRSAMAGRFLLDPRRSFLGSRAPR